MGRKKPKPKKAIYVHGDPGALLRDFAETIENPDGAKWSLSLILVSEGTPFAWTYGETPQWIRAGLKSMTPLHDFGLDELDISNQGWTGPYRG